MDSVLFRNTRIVDRASKHSGQNVDVLVESGKIGAIKAPGTIDGKKTKNIVEGGCLSPGWVDMRVHLCDPGHEWREDLHSLAAAALAGGYSTILCIPDTSPAIDNAGQANSLRNRAASLPIHLYFAGALSAAQEGKDIAELYDMHLAGAVAFSDGRSGSESAGLLLRGMQYVRPFDGLIIESPVDMSIVQDASVAEGKSATSMGMKGFPVLAEEMALERCLRLLSYFPARMHLGPITTSSGLAIVRAAKALGQVFTVETSGLYLLLDDSENESFDSVTKVFPPLQDRDSAANLRLALAEGLIDVVSSSHHPQGPEEKAHDFADAAFGAETLETSFAAVVTAMQNVEHELDPVVAAFSRNPRKILGLSPCTIAEGAEAELTAFDPWTTWVPEATDIRSKSKYNPLLGKTLHGRPTAVYVRGVLHRIGS